MVTDDTIRNAHSAMEVLSGNGDGSGQGVFAQCLMEAVRQSDLNHQWWSDAFFNWRLECFDADATIEEAAMKFRELFPNCPMNKRELCDDYEARM